MHLRIATVIIVFVAASGLLGHPAFGLRDVAGTFLLLRNTTTNDFVVQLVPPGETPSTSGWLARCFYNASLNITGWDVLNVRPHPDILAANASEAYYSMGYLEGYLTSELISARAFFKLQEMNYTYHEGITNSMNSFILPSFYQNQNVTSIGSPYNRTIASFVSMMFGIVAGYQKASFNVSSLVPVNFTLLTILNADLEFASPSEIIPTNPTTNTTMNTTVYESQTHCNVIGYDLGNDFVFGHASYGKYSEMLRLHKTYHLETLLTFSGYAGCISSIDDFVLTSNGLAATQTGNSVRTPATHLPFSLWKFLRSAAANILAKNGSEWGSYFIKYNSGTDNADWAIVDQSRFDPSQPTVELRYQVGFLHMVEQAWNFTAIVDATYLIHERGYVGLVDVPFWPQRDGRVSWEETMQKYTSGPVLDYWNTARSAQVRRGLRSAKTVQDLKVALRLNDFRRDPLSMEPVCEFPTRFNYCWPNRSFPNIGLGDRDDLVPKGALEGASGTSHDHPQGTADGKVISLVSFQRSLRVAPGQPRCSDGVTLDIRMEVKCGPSVSIGQLPPYRPNRTSSVEALIFPVVYNFSWWEYSTCEPPMVV